MDFQARGPREGLVAGRADVAFLRLGVGRVRRGADVVVVLPGIGGGHQGRGVRLRREAGGEWALAVHGAAYRVAGLVRRVEGSWVGDCSRGS